MEHLDEFENAQNYFFACGLVPIMYQYFIATNKLICNLGFELNFYRKGVTRVD